MLEVLRDIAPRFAALHAAYGEALVEPELVEPNGRFFPDPFELDADSVARMLKRMMSYAPLGERVAFELAFAPPEGEAAGGGGCGSGACGTGGGAGAGVKSGSLMILGDSRYGVMMNVGDVGDPAVLATCLARAVGGMVLHEAGEAHGDDLGAASELSASVCGLGVLLLNGASIYKKGCGGLRQHRATQLGLAEHAIATALFCRLHDRPLRAARSHLAVTQGEAFDEALRWVDGNDALLAKMRATPELVAAGAFEVGNPKGFFSRLFGGRRASELPADLEAARPSRAPRSAEEQRRIAETRALVEQALASGPDQD